MRYINSTYRWMEQELLYVTTQLAYFPKGKSSNEACLAQVCFNNFALLLISKCSKKQDTERNKIKNRKKVLLRKQSRILMHY